MKVSLAERLTELSSEFSAHLKALGYSPKTRTMYRRDLDHFIAWTQSQKGLKGLTDIRRSDLLAYQQFLLLSVSPTTGKPRTSATRNHFIAAIRSFFKYLVEAELLLSNPAELMAYSKTRTKLPEILTVREVHSLLAAIPHNTLLGKRDRAAVEVIYGTAIRINEFFHLDLEDLCFSEALMTVRFGKGGKQRVLPLTTEALFALKTYIQEARPRLATGKLGGKHRNLERHFQALWLSQEGARWAEPSIRTALKKYADLAGLKKRVSPHLLRHSCATHLLVGRANIRHIQVLLGHETLSTTQKYTHLDASDLSNCIKRYHPRSVFGA